VGLFTQESNMHEQRTNYKLAEQAAQQRLNDWIDPIENQGDLSRELALARSLLEQAVQTGNTGLAKDMLGVISNLNKAHRIEQIRMSEYLSKAIVIRLGRQMAELTAEEFADVPGWEDRLGRVLERMTLAVSEARNEPLKLESRE
jgi:molecular chaperone GrpE (heat shock protein)